MIVVSLIPSAPSTFVLSSICNLYLNNERINFSYKYKFENEGKYSLKVLFKRTIKNSFIFNKCSSLTSLNLYNFNTNNTKDMNYMFNKCSFLTALHLSILILIMIKI